MPIYAHHQAGLAVLFNSLHSLRDGCSTFLPRLRGKHPRWSATGFATRLEEVCCRCADGYSSYGYLHHLTTGSEPSDLRVPVAWSPTRRDCSTLQVVFRDQWYDGSLLLSSEFDTIVPGAQLWNERLETETPNFHRGVVWVNHSIDSIATPWYPKESDGCKAWRVYLAGYRQPHRRPPLFAGCIHLAGHSGVPAVATLGAMWFCCRYCTWRIGLLMPVNF